jgi:hypothetical protein
MTSARKIKLKLEQRKPRNPLVVPALRRKAGEHRDGPRRARDQWRREVKAALKDIER